MALDLMELARTDFRTTRQADELNSRFQKLLGSPHRYGPARLALGISLSDPSPLAPLDANADDVGKPIKGEQLFGTAADLATWIALLVERSAFTGDVVKRDFQAAVAAHWHRGTSVMWQAWKSCDNDFDQFMVHVMQRAGLKETGEASLRDGGSEPQNFGPIDLTLGNPGIDLVSNQRVGWRMNARGVSPHIALMGTLGTGKTRLANDFIAQIRKQAPGCGFVVFDMGKGDLAGNASLVESLEATVVRPPKAAVPLDVLSLGDESETTLLDAARRFRDSFARAPVSRLGAKQQDAVREGTIRALRRSSPATLLKVKEAMRELYDEQKRQSDIVTATLNELCDYSLFTPQLSPAAFFKRNWIIDVHEADEMTQRLVVYMILDAIDVFLTRLSDSPLDAEYNRALRLVVVIDEARKLLGSNHPSLINIVRTARSKGGAVMFITQSPDDFVAEEENFLENIGLALSFRTNAQSAALRAVLGEKVDLGGLPNGICVTRLPDRRGSLRVRAWE
jgi:Cdc6-like AAA superfamily ATPase